VNAVYSNIWQGEGPSAGRTASIIRLMGCNLTCAWQTPLGVSPCDEAQTWDASRFNLREQGKRMTVDEIVHAALYAGRKPYMVILTGGEPLLHQHHPGWADLVDRLSTAAVRIEIETNGTIMPSGWDWPVDQFNVSPKLASSGVAQAKRVNPTAAHWLVKDPRAVFKFVCATPDDVAEAYNEWVTQWGIPRERAWVMPAGDNANAVLATARAIEAAAIDYGFNFTLRQHILIYDKEGEKRA
jgi:7-carboxy-7-deazaguanine synthase